MATVSRWADEDPAAMRRLLADAELRTQLIGALDDLAPEAALSSVQVSKRSS